VQEQSAWDTWVVPLLNGEQRRWSPNASGLVWIDKRRLLFSEIKNLVTWHVAIVAADEIRAGARDIYVPPSESGMAAAFVLGVKFYQKCVLACADEEGIRQAGCRFQ